jgi:hypothetical protein
MRFGSEVEVHAITSPERTGASPNKRAKIGIGD